MRKFQTRSALLTFLMVGFVTLFSVGCGDSRDDFIGSNGGNTGNLVFNFQQPVVAQATTTVPNGTVNFRFDLFSTNPPQEGTLVESRGPIAYADRIVLNGVSTNVAFVAVTALNSDGVPLAIFTGSTDVILAQDNAVSLDGTNPVTFDSLSVTPEEIYLVTGGEQQLTFNGTFTPGGIIPLTINNTFASFTGQGSFVNISSTGLVELNTLPIGQNVTVTANYDILSTQRTDTFTVGRINFAANSSRTFFGSTGTVQPVYTANFTDSDGTSAFNVAANSTFSLQGNPTGVSIDANTGAVTIGAGAADPTNFVIVVQWIDTRNPGTGVTVQDTINATYTTMPI